MPDELTLALAADSDAAITLDALGHVDMEVRMRRIHLRAISSLAGFPF
jgi:hypothetical protein